MSSPSQKTVLGRLCLMVGAHLSLLGAFTGGAIASAQNLPNFTTGPGGETALLTDSSPAAATVANENKVYVAYLDHSSQHLAIATTTAGGASTAWSAPTITTLPSGTAINAIGESTFAWVVFNAGGRFFYTMVFSNGTAYQQEMPVNLPISPLETLDPNSRPGLAFFNGILYMSVNVNTNSGPQIRVFRSFNDSPSNFAAEVTPSTLNTTSGSSLAVFAPAGRGFQLYVCFRNSSGNPVLAGSPDGTNFNSPGIAPLQFNGDPDLVSFFTPGNQFQALYIFGRSIVSHNYEVATGTYDGFNFAPSNTYAQTLTQSPTLAIVPSSGYLLTVYKSNFSSNIWNSSAP